MKEKERKNERKNERKSVEEKNQLSDFNVSSIQDESNIQTSFAPLQSTRQPDHSSGHKKTINTKRNQEEEEEDELQKHQMKTEQNVWRENPV